MLTFPTALRWRGSTKLPGGLVHFIPLAVWGGVTPEWRTAARCFCAKALPNCGKVYGSPNINIPRTKTMKQPPNRHRESLAKAAPVMAVTLLAALLAVWFYHDNRPDDVALNRLLAPVFDSTASATTTTTISTTASTAWRLGPITDALPSFFWTLIWTNLFGLLWHDADRATRFGRAEAFCWTCVPLAACVASEIAQAFGAICGTAQAADVVMGVAGFAVSLGLLRAVGQNKGGFLRTFHNPNDVL